MSFENPIYQTAKQLLTQAACKLREDVQNSIACAKNNETKVAKAQLEAILENIEAAEENKVPICQDTGVPVFYVRVGDGCNVKAEEIKCGITRAVADATGEIPLRPNVVHPLKRNNTNNNAEQGFPHIEFDYVSGNKLEITAKLVGCGCETLSHLEMLRPTTSEDEIIEKIAQFAENAGGLPCPPYILGIAIGGTADLAMKEAKLQTLRTIKPGECSELEKKLITKINALGIGPMGLGGTTTALAVHIKKIGTHTGLLPLAINTCCWAARDATAVINGEKR